MMGDLSTNFSRWEFTCKCGCGFDRVDPALIVLLENIRSDVGGPVSINSGCRCETHNTSVSGAKHSPHKLGEAADIQVEGGRHRFIVAESAYKHGAMGVGTYKGWIHADVHRGSVNCARPSAWAG